ncbi:putative leucine-rich repeat-containing protein DDB_G0290503 [Calliphora vicina]|uniref:putative leucine-rich repeat-containing protein DDB_G0290503 n=1 Tax=Calliphora vicina TaxID=7373 RepID=UPI00325B9CFF
MQNEQQHLQKQIREILLENSRLNSKLDVLKSATPTIPLTTDGESRDDATREKLTNEAFQNVKKQIDYLQAENNDLRSLNKNFQKTIENLEKEIQNYRNQLFNSTSVCEVKHKFATAIKLLESTIINQKSELKEQSQTIGNLFEQKKLLRDRIEKVEKLLEEKTKELEKLAGSTETIGKLQEQLNETERHNNELQKSLKISRQSIEERLKREQSALQKVQEALNIAETAVADKEIALKRERVVKEECENIASTIGQVMDEAARKVEKDMEAIKNKYFDKEKLLNEEKSKLNGEIQNQKKFIQILDTRCNRFQQKYRDAMSENANLSDQLEQAAKTLYEMEGKIKQLEYQNNEVNCQKRSVDQENEIQHYVKTNRVLKERYITIINDLSENFEKKIVNLQDELTRLKAENQAFKLQKT